MRGKEEATIAGTSASVNFFGCSSTLCVEEEEDREGVKWKRRG